MCCVCVCAHAWVQYPYVLKMSPCIPVLQREPEPTFDAIRSGNAFSDPQKVEPSTVPLPADLPAQLRSSPTGPAGQTPSAMTWVADPLPGGESVISSPTIARNPLGPVPTAESDSPQEDVSVPPGSHDAVN